MNLYEMVDVAYTKNSSGEKTDRVIIPTQIPTKNIKAIDVTHLSEAERSRIENMYKEYVLYYTLAVERLFNFEEWMEHTTYPSDQPIKWRTFIKDNITIKE